uniref:Uncharacterized protein n=1 Tax=Trieres chinensis TaxID=1514140 RepID=A0A7S2E6R4_TRICV|mmetsp:Transcript_10084/g.21285  ORF Transcript_10084/g.21285 Transcript_10084/m.21285 type:complete len:188 (+) Transcript_10084:126-689(+)
MSGTGPYRRVSNRADPPTGAGGYSDGGGGGGLGGPTSSSMGGGGPHTGNAPSSRSRTASERASEKLQALAWIGAALVTSKLSKLPSAFASDPRVLRPLLNFSLLLLAVNAILTLYLAIYLPRIKGLSDPSAWSAYRPNLIPAMTGIAVLCGALMIRALWPVWGFVTPLVLGTVGLGAMEALHFVPWL